METTLKVTENGFYRIVKTKEVVHYLNKMEKELVKKLGSEKGEQTYGALRKIWYSEFTDKEDILHFIRWYDAQLCIVDIAGLIEESTYKGLQEQVRKVLKDVINMPM